MSTVKLYCGALPNMPWQEKPASCSAPVWRYTENPVIGRNPLPGVERIFNSAVVPYQGAYIVFSAASRSTASRISIWDAAPTASTGILTRIKFPL